MQILSVEIKNFRSIEHLMVEIQPLTKLLGANNAGKSTVLSAIELFFEPAPKLNELDHHKKDIRQPIAITIEFHNLTPVEREEFVSAIIDSRLRVTRELSCTETDAMGYSVAARVNPDFTPIRGESGARKLAAYRDLASRYGESLPTVRSANDVETALLAWEADHPDQLVIETVRSLFGATNVANGKLLKKTAVRLVPAVKEVAAELKDSKKSPIISLLADIARQSLDNRDELRHALLNATEAITRLIDPTQYPELVSISSQLTSSLQKYYSGCRIDADWMLGKTLDFVPPIPRIQVESNGLQTPIENVGHGLQRAVLFSLIEFLASNALGQIPDGGGFVEPASDIILLIEEPEIYQHPSKQITISRALSALTERFNQQNGIRVQIIFTTHSEKFVDLHSLSNVRILRRRGLPGEFTSICRMCSISEVTQELSQAFDPPKIPWSDEQFVGKLHIFNREVSEGFFAEKIVLVEGVGDRAAMQSVFQFQKRDPDAEGLAIIQVDGKTKIDKPWVIFRRLGIPVFVIFDNDVSDSSKKRESSINYNRVLQRIGGCKDLEDFPSGVHQQFCALDGSLEALIERSLGERAEEILGQVSEEFGVSGTVLLKSPAAVRAVLSIGASLGVKFDEFNKIIAAVDAL